MLILTKTVVSCPLLIEVSTTNWCKITSRQFSSYTAYILTLHVHKDSTVYVQ